LSRLELFIAIWWAVLIGGFGYVLLLILQTAAVNYRRRSGVSEGGCTPRERRPPTLLRRPFA